MKNKNNSILLEKFLDVVEQIYVRLEEKKTDNKKITRTFCKNERKKKDNHRN